MVRVFLAYHLAHDILMQIGESAGPECKAVLQEITSLVDQKLETNGKELKATFDASEVNIFIIFLVGVRRK